MVACSSLLYDGAGERFYPWDYGLNMALQLLCSYRRRGLPFEFQDKVWDKLEERKKKLQGEQQVLRLDP